MNKYSFGTPITCTVIKVIQNHIHHFTSMFREWHATKAANMHHSSQLLYSTWTSVHSSDNLFPRGGIQAKREYVTGARNKKDRTGTELINICPCVEFITSVKVLYFCRI